MWSLICQDIRGVEASHATQGISRRTVEFTQDWARVLAHVNEFDFKLLVYVNLKGVTGGYASLQPQDISAAFACSTEQVVESFKRLNVMRIETRRPLLVAWSTSKHDSMFQIAWPTDDDINRVRNQKLKEIS